MLSFCNYNRIRQGGNSIILGGRKMHYFSFHKRLGISDCRIKVENSDICLAEKYHKMSSLCGSSNEFLGIIMEKKYYATKPKTQQILKACMLLL